MAETEVCPYCGTGGFRFVGNITQPPQDIFQCNDCGRLHWPTLDADTLEVAKASIPPRRVGRR
jgi:hypothetical protein